MDGMGRLGSTAGLGAELFPEDLDFLSDPVFAELLQTGLYLRSSEPISSPVVLTGKAIVNEKFLEELVADLTFFLTTTEESPTILANNQEYEYKSYSAGPDFYFSIRIKVNPEDILSLKFNSSRKLVEAGSATPEQPRLMSLPFEELFSQDHQWNTRLIAIKNTLVFNSSETRVVELRKASDLPPLRNLSSAYAGRSFERPSGVISALEPRSRNVEGCLIRSDSEQILPFSVDPSVSIDTFAINIYEQGRSHGLDPSSYTELRISCSVTGEKIVYINSQGIVTWLNDAYDTSTYNEFVKAGRILTYCLKQISTLSISIDGLSRESTLISLAISSNSTFQKAANRICKEVQTVGKITDKSNLILIYDRKKIATIKDTGELAWIEPSLKRDSSLKTLFKTNTISFRVVKDPHFSESMFSLFLGDFLSFEDDEYKITSTITPPSKTLILERKIDPPFQYELVFLNETFATLTNRATSTSYRIEEVTNPQSDINKILTPIARNLRARNLEMELLRQYLDPTTRTISIGGTLTDKEGHTYIIKELTSRKITLTSSETSPRELNLSLDEPMTREERKLFIGIVYQ